VATGPNLLTAAQSDFEDGSTGGWSAPGNCTIANSTAQAHTGTHSLAMTGTGSGDMSVISAPRSAVVGGYTYQQTCWYRAATAPRSVWAFISWYDNTGAFITNSIGSPVTDSTSAWTRPPMRPRSPRTCM
jgi:hypothetical protein